MEYCKHCGKTLDVERRWAKIHGQEYYFCPTNPAPLSPDCLNSYLKILSFRNRRTTDAHYSRRSPLL
jgi:YHS domain-containing protein